MILTTGIQKLICDILLTSVRIKKYRGKSYNRQDIISNSICSIRSRYNHDYSYQYLMIILT